MSTPTVSSGKDHTRESEIERYDLMFSHTSRHCHRTGTTASSAILTLCVALLLMLLAIPAPVYAQEVPPALMENLQARIDSFQAAGDFPGVSVGIRLPDGTSFGLVAGVSDRATGREMQPEDRMLVGSTGKTFVAAVALQLVSEEKLDLDAHVRYYLGGESWYNRLPNGDAVTVRMLMTHTSGIIRYEFNEAFLTDLLADPDRVWRPEELVAYLFDTDAPFAAGQGWTYSDTNYILLGMIIERLTGRTLYQEIEDRLLIPLKLDEMVPSDSRVIPGLIQGYAGQGNAFTGTDEVIHDGQFAINPQFEWAGGGFAGTPRTLARWAADIYEGRAYDPALLEEALDGVPARLGRDTTYGLGVIIWPMGAGTAWGHSGFFPGYLTEMRYFPEHRIAIAWQVNTSDQQKLGSSPVQLIDDLVRIILAQKNQCPVR
ncbi:serine hydrolase domain-containing protein [Gemmatimonadota bacterium]